MVYQNRCEVQLLTCCGTVFLLGKHSLWLGVTSALLSAGPLCHQCTTTNCRKERIFVAAGGWQLAAGGFLVDGSRPRAHFILHNS